MTVTGTLLKNQRKSIGMSQTTLATKLKIFPQGVNNIENGSSPLPAKFVKKISKILNVPKELLITSLITDYNNYLTRRTK